MKKQYLSPSVRFESILLLEKIANPCWAYTSNSKYTQPLGFDVDGVGRISVTGSNCGHVDLIGISDPQIEEYLKGNAGQPSTIATFLCPGSK